MFSILLDRIIELENEYSLKSNGRSSLSPPLSSALAQPGSSALPRTLLGARARASFVANLREAVDDPDDDADPILTSRHVGPEARRRYEEESRERFDQESREPRRSARRTRSSLTQVATSSHKDQEPNISAHRHPFTPYSTSSHYMAPGEGGSPQHNTSGSRSTPPIASSSRGHSNYSPLPSTQSHPHLYTHPPPLPPPHFQDQHYSNSRQHSLSPEQDDYHSPGSGIGTKMRDDSPSDMFDYTPPPSNSRPTRGAITSTKDHDANDQDHRSNGHADPTINPNFPFRTENASNPVSVSRNPDSSGSSSAPRRGTTRTRRSNRVEHAASHHVDDEIDQPEPARRTRAASKRGNTSASPAVRTRTTRRGNAAAAAADAEAKAAESREVMPQHDSSPSSRARAAPPLASSSGVAPSETDPQLQDVQMHNASRVDEAAPNQGTVVPTTSVGPASSHPPYLDPALASESTAQVSFPTAQGTAVSSNPAAANSFETPVIQSSPMDSIVRVAEAAVAAQNAANAAMDQTSLSATSSAAAPQPTVRTTNLFRNGGTSSALTSATTPSSATFNPYMMPGTATAVKPTVNTMGPGMPVAHPMALAMNPYAIYYPPGMPMSPNTPTYPYANPYYYMAAMPGPNAMYPTSPTFAPPSAQRSQSEVQRHAKPKRLKAHTVTSKNFSIPMVPRDKSGKPMLPLNVGIMTVIKLGDVCTREHFHTERYIFPVGYEVSRSEPLDCLSRVQMLIRSFRRYLSTVDSNIEVVYHCTILDGGDGPKFQIIPSDVPDRPVIAGTATGAWSSIVKQANAIRNRQHSNSVSGPDFFGLGQNTIKHLIQELPNADRLRDYVWQRFVEGGYVLRPHFYV